MQRLFLVLALALAATACQTGQPQQTVAALESGLSIAERTAIGYVSLPRCPQTTAICSDAVMVAKIAGADTAAYNAIRGAANQVKSGANPDFTAAAAALAAFQAVLADPAVAPVISAVVKGN